MRQLALPVRLRASSVFESFFLGPNTAAIQQLQKSILDPALRTIWLYGASGLGKTHLLQAICARAAAQRWTAAYFPLRDTAAQSADLLVGCEALNIVCLDDFDAVVGNSGWERAVFRLYTEMDDNQGHIVIASAASPGAANIGLRDLASRLAAGAVIRLQPLTDEQQVQAMQLRASQRGMELPFETAQYLIKRLPRDMHSLCDVLDTLDEASLIDQRRLTVPFVRAALDAEQS